MKLLLVLSWKPPEVLHKVPFPHLLFPLVLATNLKACYMTKSQTAVNLPIRPCMEPLGYFLKPHLGVLSWVAPLEELTKVSLASFMDHL